MKYYLRKFFPYILLPLVLIVALVLWTAFFESSITVIHSEDSVWDLPDIDFENTFISLAGPIEHIPNALLTPEQFKARQSEAVVSPLPEMGYMTSRLRLRFPDDNWYTVGYLALDRAVNIFVDGQFMLSMGVVGRSAEDESTDSSRISFTVRPDNDIVEIIVQSSNLNRAVTHTDTIGWYVGGGYLQDTFRRVDLMQNIIMGAFFLLGVFAVLLHFNIRSKIRGNNINLLFALFCLTWFFGTGVTGTKPLADFLPWLSWEAQYRIEFINVHMTTGLLVAIINSLFPGLLHKYFRVGMYIISVGFVVASAVIDLSLMHAVVGTDGPEPFIFLAGVAYVAFRFIVKLRNITRAQYVFLCGVALFLYITLRDALWHLDVILLPPFSGDGLMVFYEFMIMTAAVTAFMLTICMALAVFLNVSDEAEAANRLALDAVVKEQTLAADNAALDRLNRMKSDIMEVVSHETRTPLAVMSGYIELIAEDLRNRGVDEQTANDLDRIVHETQRIAAIMKEMQSFSQEKDSTEGWTYVQLADVICQSAALYKPILERKNTGLIINLPDDLPLVLGSAKELTQVLFNLLQNAKNHTENGEITISAAAEKGSLIVTVSDTGEGIPCELLHHVFERKMTTKSEGSGLGLSICRDIINAHSGEIEIESEPGKGTSVRFAIPIGKREESDAGKS